jgi:hypothetical protein
LVRGTKEQTKYPENMDFWYCGSTFLTLLITLLTAVLSSFLYKMLNFLGLAWGIPVICKAKNNGGCTRP